jgi:hypothetical protein
LALIGGLSTVEGKAKFEKPPYWDNELLGFDSLTGTYSAAPVADTMYQIEDNQSTPAYKNDLQIL